MQPLSILTCGAGDVVISSRRCSKRSHLLHAVTTISATRETVLLKQPVFRLISFQENSEFSGTAFQNIWRVGFQGRKFISTPMRRVRPRYFDEVGTLKSASDKFR